MTAWEEIPVMVEWDSVELFLTESPLDWVSHSFISVEVSEGVLRVGGTRDRLTVSFAVSDD